MTVKFVGTGITYLKTVFSCYLYLRGLLDRSYLISKLVPPLSKPNKFGTLDCGKVYSLAMNNDVAHLAVVKTAYARFCKKFGYWSHIEFSLVIQHYVKRIFSHSPWRPVSCVLEVCIRLSNVVSKYVIIWHLCETVLVCLPTPCFTTFSPKWICISLHRPLGHMTTVINMPILW